MKRNSCLLSCCVFATHTRDGLGTRYSKYILIASKCCLYRVEKLACQVDAQSPVLSDAEVNMAKELKGLITRLDHLKQKLGEVR